MVCAAELCYDELRGKLDRKVAREQHLRKKREDFECTILAKPLQPLTLKPEKELRLEKMTRLHRRLSRRVREADRPSRQQNFEKAEPYLGSLDASGVEDLDAVHTKSVAGQDGSHEAPGSDSEAEEQGDQQEDQEQATRDAESDVPDEQTEAQVAVECRRETAPAECTQSELGAGVTEDDVSSESDWEVCPQGAEMPVLGTDWNLVV
mmetsp:Transcript_21911/g.51211  ORF Transcript_21911/g.51211 Transcript_21911/m.51211 type:complete len:207 (+) Transcript_21911:86-706(+)